MVLAYVDDILCATNIESAKMELFTKLNVSYGIQDQGVLSKYLGVQVKLMTARSRSRKAYMLEKVWKRLDFAMHM